MNLKLLRSALYLLSVSALFTGVAIAQSGDEGDLKAKFANDYNEGKFRNAIADAAALQKIHALDTQLMLVTAQAYYKVGDYPGCMEYAQETLDISPNEPGAQLLERCRSLLQ